MHEGGIENLFAVPLAFAEIEQGVAGQVAQAISLEGTIDTPGGWRFKTPYPKPIPPGPQPAGSDLFL